MKGKVFYRAVFAAEHSDWLTNGRLRSPPGGMEGKHFTERPELARAFGCMFRDAGWESGSFWVLKVTFCPSANVIKHAEKQDGIGPSYFADETALQLILNVDELFKVNEE